MAMYSRLKDINILEKVNGRVLITFLARSVTVRLQKDKASKFLDIEMHDRGTSIEAKLFNATDKHIDLIKSGGVYNAAVDIKPYAKSQNGISCIIYNIEKGSAQVSEFVEWADGLSNSKRVIEDSLREIIETPYGKIAHSIIASVWGRFAVWTAGKSMHHNQLGGLLAHTAEVIDTCELLYNQYSEKYGEDFIDKALVMSAAIIHDFGKIYELEVDTISGSTEYSQNSSLFNHIMHAICEVEKQAAKLGIGVQEFEVNDIGEEQETKTDEDLKLENEAILLLKHCIASHHGKESNGSFMSPSVPEAYIIHIADIMSSEMFKFNRDMQKVGKGKSLLEWAPDGARRVYRRLES